MANRYFKQFALVKSGRTIILAGKISLNSSAAVTASTVDFASVAKTGTGEYTITLDDKYVETKSIQLTVAQAANSQIVAQVKADTQATDNKIVIATLVSGAAANIAVAAEIHVLLVLKDSTVS